MTDPLFIPVLVAIGLLSCLSLGCWSSFRLQMYRRRDEIKNLVDEYERRMMQLSYMTRLTDALDTVHKVGGQVTFGEWRSVPPTKP